MMTSFSREWLKWSALLLMTGDHVNKVLLAGAYPWLSEAARVVFPIFAVILVYNLHAHPDPQAIRRAMHRLLIVALIAQPFHAWAFGYWLPLNVLATLWLGLRIVHAPLHVGVLLFVFAGFFVDYQWSGLLVILGASHMLRHPRTWHGPALLGLGVTSLLFVNGNAWAVLALPLIWLLRHVDGTFPRSRWTFLGYYVGHLALLAILANY